MVGRRAVSISCLIRLLKFEVELEDVIPFVEETTPATTDEAAAATTQAANSALPVKK